MWKQGVTEQVLRTLVAPFFIDSKQTIHSSNCTKPG